MSATSVDKPMTDEEVKNSVLEVYQRMADGLYDPMIRLAESIENDPFASKDAKTLAVAILHLDGACKKGCLPPNWKK